MADTMTRIRLPGQRDFVGLMDHGALSAEHMIEQVRNYAAYHRAQAEAIERAADADFQIDVVRGVVVQHHVRTVQKAAS